jgi:hypothetical protein
MPSLADGIRVLGLYVLAAVIGCLIMLAFDRLTDQR